jgi:hypothetical protein
MVCKCGHFADDHPEHMHFEENVDNWKFPCTKCSCANYDMVLIKIEFGKYDSDKNLWYIRRGQYLILATQDDVKELLKQMKQEGF